MSKKVNIFQLAKKIQRLKPSLSWQAAIQAASKQHKKVGAVKLIEKGEKKSTPAKKTLQVVRTATGRFKGYKTVSGVTKKHTDTKSHNVSIKIGSAESGSPFKSISEVKAANAAKGFYFFSPGTMKFFKSKVVSALLFGRYFITSEIFEGSDYKKYKTFKIRYVENSANIKTPDQPKFSTMQQAKDYLKKHLL